MVVNKPIVMLMISTLVAFISNTSKANTQAEAERKYQQQQQLQQQRDDIQKKTLNPESNISIDTNQYKEELDNNQLDPASDIPKSSTCFDIHNLSLDGKLAKRFKFALRPYLSGRQSVLGSCMGVPEINKLVANVQNQIIDRGYVTTRVRLKNQNLAAGSLKLTIIPGFINQVKTKNMPSTGMGIRNDAGNPASFWIAMPMKAGDLLNIREIEQTLENLKRVPSAEAEFSIKPSDVKAGDAGYSDLLIQWKQNRRFRLSLTLDDSGGDSTGKYLANTTVSLDNPLWLNDILYASFGHNLDGLLQNKKNNSRSYNIGYSIPLSYGLLTLTHNGHEYEQKVAGANEDYIYSGESQGTEASFGYLVHRNQHAKAHVKAGMYLKAQKNFINDTEVEVQRRRTSGWKASLSYETQLKRTRLNTNLSYKAGLDAFDALVAPETKFGEGNAKAGIVKFDTRVSHPFTMSKRKVTYVANLKTQYALENLVPNDRFSIGSRYTVRGFEGSRSLVGDHGALFKQEISTPFYGPTHHVYAGVDMGYVKMVKKKQDDLLLGHYLAGTNLGIRGAFAKQRINYDLFVGYPIKQPEKFADKEITSGFSLGWQY